MRDALEKEVGEFHRECDYFSFSRLEEPTLGDSAEAFDTSNLATEEQPATRGDPFGCQSPDQGVDVAAECSSPDEPTDSTASLNSSAVTNRKQSDGNSTMDRLEHEVELLIKQVSFEASAVPGDDDGRRSLHRFEGSLATIDFCDHVFCYREFFSELFRRYLQYAAAGSAVLSRNAKNNPAAAKFFRMNSRRQEKRNHRLNMRCLCLHAMAIVYGRCHSEIGPVSDIPLLVHLLDRTVSAAERDCLLMLLEKLVLNKYNADEFLEADGVRVVSDLAGLAHLHTSRAPPPTETNILMGGDDPDSQEGGGVTQKEWWYWQTDGCGGGSGSSTGPLSFAEVGLLSERPLRCVYTAFLLALRVSLWKPTFN
ncbi:unnamed protein product [Dibothriocephalus latus]|uniref:Uncharacterized protein n=1 Tax=Dibothriocephalus latus TaxID=60516 RepID=A0A3P7LXR8_DIBLA|nr:unnamed protein product [Dibothriocephalus latus]